MHIFITVSICHFVGFIKIVLTQTMFHRCTVVNFKKNEIMSVTGLNLMTNENYCIEGF